MRPLRRNQVWSCTFNEDRSKKNRKLLMLVACKYRFCAFGTRLLE